MTRPLDPERWARVEAVFDEAADLPPDARDDFLDRACDGDPVLRAEVESLLTAGEAGLDHRLRAVELVADDVLASAAPTAIGQRLGAYRLEEEIGRGGMGVVYRAVHEGDDFTRTVAVKVLPGALFSPSAVRRFRAERRILAGLEHPNIARLLDGGATPEGVPYVVMEYVDGAPLDRFARDRDLEARIRLFLGVCDAVQYAHRNLVVHGDLKPANILVTDDGVPKLLDFGIARLLDADDPDTDARTRTRIMTPRFASPEQLRGERIGTGSDVYSLGRVLFRLLTGADPFEDPARVNELEPPAASDVAGDRRLRGDLDTIVLEALQREVEDRYHSVRALADDLDRYLAGQPIAAHPPTLRYRAGKFLRRHALPVAAGAALVLSLAGGLGAAAWQGRRAERARQEAERALARSETTTAFLVDLFNAADPRNAQGEDVTAVELVDRGVARIDELDDDPTLQARLLHTLAIVEMQLGRYDDAADLAERSATLRRTMEPDSALVASLNTWGQSLFHLGRPDSAAAVFEEALRHSVALFGRGHDESLGLMNNLAIVYGRLDRTADAVSILRDLVATERRVYDADDPVRTFALNNLGVQLTWEGKFAEAEPLLRESLRIREVGTPEGDLGRAAALDNLGMMLREAGRFEEAEPLLREALAIRQRVLGDEHRFYAESLFAFGTLLALRAGPADLPNADSLLHRALDVLRATLEPDHPAVAYALHSLGILARQQGDLDAAEDAFRQALAVRRGSGRDAATVTVETLSALADILRLRGSAEATATARDAVALARERLPATHPDRAEAEAVLGLVVAAAARPDADAQPLARRAAEPGAASAAAGREAAALRFATGLGSLRRALGPDHPRVRRLCAEAQSLDLTPPSACTPPP